MSNEDHVTALEAQLREFGAGQADISRVLAQQTMTLAEHTRRFDDLDAGVKTIIEMLGTLINRGEQGSPS